MKVHPVLLGFSLVGCTGTADGPSGGGDDSGAAEDADKDGYDVDVDCDDGDPSIHPDAEEVCDGVDNDCVDGVDVGATDATDYFVDEDGDGYGAGAATESCEPLAGQVTNGDDCDDDHAEAHPGADEVCGDDVDEDCDGEAPSCRYTGEIDYHDADARLQGEAGTSLGYDATPAGDMNGDGIGDLAVGKGDYAGDGFGASLYYGPISGTIEPAAVSASITNASDGDGVGFDLRGVGDQDGDGYDDLVITGGMNKASAAAGGVYVVLGPITGTHPVNEVASATIAGEPSNGVGWSPAAGDVNDDGIVDLMVGAPGTDALTGAAYVFYGPVTSGNLTTSDADASFAGWHKGDFTGGCNAANGDIDGDGIADVLVSADAADPDDDDDGAAYLFHGPVGGAYSVRDADTTFIGGPPGRHLGWFSSIGGDLDGDGLDDVGLSAPYGFVDGSVYIVYGDHIDGASEIDVSKTGAIVWGTPGSYAQLGVYIDTAGDLDSDGKDDLAIGSWVSDNYNGTVWVFYGPISGEVHAYEASFVVPGEFAQGMGASTVFVGDVTGDDLDDLAVGANYATVDDEYGSGTVFLFDGTVDE
jgi:hypothetical protein